MATNLNETVDLTAIAELFKVDYQKLYENYYNSTDVALAMIPKTSNFTGSKQEFPVPVGYKAGIGFGSLPEARAADYKTMSIYAKKMYARTFIDRETIYASMSSKGAFVEAMAHDIEKTVEAHTWNRGRSLFGNGDGSLGTIDTGGVTDNTGGNYSLVISSSSWKEANWEEGMLVNVHTGTDKFVIQTVTPSFRTIVVQRQSSGTDVPAQSQVVYLQGSRAAEFHGLKEMLDKVVGDSAYGQTLTRKMVPVRTNATSAGISHAIINENVINVEKQIGTPPNTAFTSYKQFRYLLDLQEDKKIYTVTGAPSDKKYKGIINFTGVGVLTSRGEMKVYPHRFVEDDRMYCLNLDHVEFRMRPGDGWVKDDIGGKGYLRLADEDKFEARIASYGNLWISLPHQGLIYGLA